MLTIILLPIIMAFLVNLLLTPLILYISHHNEWYDHIDHRKVHTGDIPRIGGVGIFLSFVIGSLALLMINKGSFESIYFISTQSILIFFTSITVVHAIGVIDDFIIIQPRFKLLAQFAAASIFIFTGHLFETLYFPFIHKTFEIGLWAYPLTFLWFIGISNAVNLLDGLDGLAGGVSAIGALGMGVSMLFLHNYSAAALSFALFGALLGFLFFNKPKAKIFMGDGGSLFLGITLAAIPLLTTTNTETADMNLILGASFLLLPIFDTAAAIIRRTIIKRQAFYKPDKEHMHHKLLDLGLNNVGILIISYILTALIGLPFIFWTKTKNLLFIDIEMYAWFFTIGYFALLNIYKKKE